MGRGRKPLLMAVSAVCALVAATGIYRVMSRGETVEANVRGGEPVVIAASDLARGTVLKADHMTVATRPADEAPAGKFSQPRPLIGRTVKRPVSAGAPIVQEALSSSSSMFEARLSPGYRAVGVFVDGRGGLQKYLQPGDRVDVVVTIDSKDALSSSKLLLQDVEILEIPRREGSSTYEETTSWMSVILAVTPWDAEKLALAMHVGTIQLLGRGSDDTQTGATSGVTRDTLVADGWVAPGPDGAQGTNYRSVELIKGQSRSAQRFSLGPGGWSESGRAATAPSSSPSSTQGQD